MDGSESTEREEYLAEVRRNGFSPGRLWEQFKGDCEIVLAAVQKNGAALQCATEECKADPEIALAAVQEYGLALQYATEKCKADRHIVQAAVEKDVSAITHAADELLLDSTFAPEVKRDFCILKISLLSGRSTVVMARDYSDFTIIVGRFCRRLGLDRRGTEALIHGAEVVPAGAK
eukprot:6423990-Amphidinium_carterae.1